MEVLFGDSTPYENDDAEADRIYEAVDERMDSRRKRAREAKLVETMKRFRKSVRKSQTNSRISNGNSRT